MQQEDTITVPESLRFSHLITSKGAVIPSDTDHDDVLDGFVRLKKLRQLVTELYRQYEQEAVGWCECNDKMLVLDQDNYYYSGYEKKYKCNDVAKALENALDLSGGDFNEMVDLLVSNPIKQGAYKKFLKLKYAEKYGGDDEESDTFAEFAWRKFFETSENVRLKEGKGKGKKLIGVNMKYRKSS